MAHGDDCRRILVVEDEALIAISITDDLTEDGYEVVGPASKLEAAMRLAREEPLDAAVLDVTIRGGRIYPVAAILRGRGVPFVLASGYGDWALPEELKGYRRLHKPFTSVELCQAVRAMC